MPLYPPTLEAALGQPLKFPPATLKAVRAFATSKPWRGASRSVKPNSANSMPTSAGFITSASPCIIGDGTGDSGGSYYSRGANVIVLAGRLSVITFLHEWGHAVKGGSEFEAWVPRASPTGRRDFGNPGRTD